jgi:hypothetical protein
MKNTIKVALLSAILAAGAVHAAAHPGPGLSSANDVKLGTDAADKFLLIQSGNINPIQSTAGFASQFTTASLTGANGWTLAETVQSDNGVLTLADTAALDGLSFSFTQAANRTTGTWSVTNTSLTKNTTVDLTLSFHAGNNVGSFLFDNQAVSAGKTLTGTWAIKWLNNANSASSIPLFSNLGIYTGQRTLTSAVPEPTTYGMMLAGLGLVGFVARRRKTS